MNLKPFMHWIFNVESSKLFSTKITTIPGSGGDPSSLALTLV